MEKRNDVLLLILSILLGISVLKITEIFQLSNQVKAVLFCNGNQGFSLITILVVLFIFGYFVFFILIAITSIGISRQLYSGSESHEKLAKLVAYCVAALTMAYCSVFSVVLNDIGLEGKSTDKINNYRQSKLLNKIPTVPKIIEQVNGDYTDSLAWLSSVDPDTTDKVQYIIEICSEKTFQSNSYNIRGIIDTNFALIKFVNKFKVDTTLGYYWRVASDDGYSKSNYSKVGKFKYSQTVNYRQQKGITK